MGLSISAKGAEELGIDYDVIGDEIEGKSFVSLRAFVVVIMLLF